MHSFGITLTKIKHSLVGGVTNGSIPMGFLGFSLMGFKSPLCRQIHQILDFLLRLEACLAVPPFIHYPATAILRLDNILLPVVYKSPHFCHTGWGFCPLSLKELACSFDLPSPSHSAVDCREHFTFLLPLKLLEAPFQHVLSSLTLALPTPVPPVMLLPSLGIIPPLHQTWLPLIQSFFFDSWFDKTLISDKAAKADEAPVPIHLWNNRSKMMFPQLTDRALSGFQTLALIWQCKYMHHHFCTFLWRKYGPDWLPRLLLTVRAQAKAIATTLCRVLRP
jgi:hypothetical protein